MSKYVKGSDTTIEDLNDLIEDLAAAEKRKTESDEKYKELKKEADLIMKSFGLTGHVHPGFGIIKYKSGKTTVTISDAAGISLRQALGKNFATYFKYAHKGIKLIRDLLESNPEFESLISMKQSDDIIEFKSHWK